MKPPIHILLVVPIMLAAVSCDGPSSPDRDGRARLEEQGYPPQVIDAVIGGGPIPTDQILGLSKCGSAEVRFLLGKNPTLSTGEIDLFIRDTDDYVRSGSAQNPSLSPAQMERLLQDPSKIVYSALARNPSVPRATLLKLHRERKPGLVCFAMNPRCPPEIAEEIRKSDDNLAKKWLAILDGANAGDQPPIK